MRHAHNFTLLAGNLFVSACFTSCGGEVAAPADAPVAIHEPAAPLESDRTAVALPVAPAVAEPEVADHGIRSLAARALGGNKLSAREREQLQAQASEAVAALLRDAAAGDVALQGRAPAVVAQLGAAALPGLEQALRHEDPLQRRLAVMALLQLGEIARPAAASLATARNDPDLAVRAAAELAWKRAIDDTSDLDRARAAHEAATRQSSR